MSSSLTFISKTPTIDTLHQAGFLQLIVFFLFFINYIYFGLVSVGHVPEFVPGHFLQTCMLIAYLSHIIKSFFISLSSLVYLHLLYNNNIIILLLSLCILYHIFVALLLFILFRASPNMNCRSHHFVISLYIAYEFFLFIIR